MVQQLDSSEQSLSEKTLGELEPVLAAFEEQWKQADSPQLAEFLRGQQGSARRYLLRELLRVELSYRRSLKEGKAIDEYRERFPTDRTLIEPVIQQFFQSHRTELANGTTPQEELFQRVREIGFTPIRLLGQGGFGHVVLARDEELERDVAIKMSNRVAHAEELQAAEARISSTLDHSGVVPVYTAGQMPNGMYYIVSKFIDGKDLSDRIESQRPSHRESAEIIASVAESLHHAHTHGLVHRDVKPANILLDRNERAYLTDFGLALRDENVSLDPALLGTVSYMSPEQARRESHLVDGRSDIFSLGVVFYELLTGRLPFHGTHAEEILRKIVAQEARPPRQWDDRIPKELERICLEAMAKSVSDRYSTALDLASDLRDFLSSSSENIEPTRAEPLPGSESVCVVPKGARSFDSRDADFFLALLPGPRDRHDLPASVRFWISRIAETHSEQTLRVGLLYGPSGSGKSSLIKAGILPRLPDEVSAAYLEATAHGTEARLRSRLTELCQGSLPDQPLGATLNAIRQGEGLPARKKLLIVIDQFEQWLHGNADRQASELVEALRQCDGKRIQAILLGSVDNIWRT